VGLLKDISHIHFSAMVVIEMQSNNIESIEGVARIRMPLLKQFYFSTVHNRETTITSGA
jgi:hypothetical protein